MTKTSYRESRSADGEDGSFPDANTFFVKNNLTINGTMLFKHILVNMQRAIKIQRQLIILGGNITIDSVDKAIKGKDSVTMKMQITINVKMTESLTDGALVINSGRAQKAGEGLCTALLI